MLSINTDLQDILLRSTLDKSTLSLNDVINKMTTGYKVNHAKDNAANYSIITDLSKRISSMLQVQQNTEDGIALLSLAEGGLQEIQEQLERLRELTMQASTGSYDSTTRAKMQQEADSIINEINRLRKSIECEGRGLYYSEEIEPLMDKINTVISQAKATRNLTSPAVPSSLSPNSTEPVAGTVELQASETKEVVIDGVKYTLKNTSTSVQTFEYSKDKSTKQLTITCNDLEITGQNNVSHNIILNGNENVLITGEKDDEVILKGLAKLNTLGGNDEIINYNDGAIIDSGVGDDKIVSYNNAQIKDNSGDDTYCLYGDQKYIRISDSAGINDININANMAEAYLMVNSVSVTSSNVNTFYINGYGNSATSDNSNNLFVTTSASNNINSRGPNSYYAGPRTSVSGCRVIGTYFGQGTYNATTLVDDIRFDITTNRQTSPIQPGALIFKNPFSGSIEVFATDATVTMNNSNLNIPGKSYVVNGQNSTISVGSYLSDVTVGAGSVNNTFNATWHNHESTFNIDSNNNTFTLFDDAYFHINVTGSGNTFNTNISKESCISGDNNVFNLGNIFEQAALNVYGNGNIFQPYSNDEIRAHDSNIYIYGHGNNFHQIVSDGYQGVTNIDILGNDNTILGTGAGIFNFTVSGNNNILNGGENNDVFTIKSGNQNVIDGNAGDINVLINRGKNTSFTNAIDATLNGFKLDLKVGIGSDDSSVVTEEISFDTIGFDVDLSTQDAARDSLSLIDEMLTNVNEQILSIGTSINRLELILDEQSINIENMISTRSTLRDADMAKESSKFIKNQIIQQASATLLSMSRNLRQENVLGLLYGI